MSRTSQKLGGFVRLKYLFVLCLGIMKKCLIALALCLTILGCATGNSVKAGDRVELDFIGYFGDGTVFDTSNESVATSPLYPKSKLFVPREYYPRLSFVVGSDQTLTSIDSAVVGMKIGQTKQAPMFFEEVFGNLIRPVEKGAFGAENASIEVGMPVEDERGLQGGVVDVRENDVLVKFFDSHEGEIIWFNITLLKVYLRG